MRYILAKNFSNFTFQVPETLFYTIKQLAAIAISTFIMAETLKLQKSSFRTPNGVLKLRSFNSLEISEEKI